MKLEPKKPVRKESSCLVETGLGKKEKKMALKESFKKKSKSNSAGNSEGVIRGCCVQEETKNVKNPALLFGCPQDMNKDV